MTLACRHLLADTWLPSDACRVMLVLKLPLTVKVSPPLVRPQKGPKHPKSISMHCVTNQVMRYLNILFLPSTGVSERVAQYFCPDSWLFWTTVQWSKFVANADAEGTNKMAMQPILQRASVWNYCITGIESISNYDGYPKLLKMLLHNQANNIDAHNDRWTPTKLFIWRHPSMLTPKSLSPPLKLHLPPPHYGRK